jgi:hypothetical protein
MIDKIHKHDIEGIRYPDAEIKRRTWDFILADKINELIEEIQDLKDNQEK